MARLLRQNHADPPWRGVNLELGTTEGWLEWANGGDKESADMEQQKLARHGFVQKWELQNVDCLLRGQNDD